MSTVAEFARIVFIFDKSGESVCPNAVIEINKTVKEVNILFILLLFCVRSYTDSNFLFPILTVSPGLPRAYTPTVLFGAGIYLIYSLVCFFLLQYH